MIFALAACGSNRSTNSTADTQPDSESTEAVAETPAEEPNGAPTEAAEDDVAEWLNGLGY